jgi:uncharacterized protein YndB with AHSA1/START domain
MLATAPDLEMLHEYVPLSAHREPVTLHVLAARLVRHPARSSRRGTLRTCNALGVTDQRDVVSVERLIAAPPEAIFELLVDPGRHRDIDGSESVRDPKGGAQRLALGARFGMSMKMGVPYSMASTVIEYDQNRRVAWQTRGPGRVGAHVGGRVWRYELEPVEGGTLVRETWDITQESAVTKPVVRRAAEKTRENMAATLERIERLVTA